LPSSVTHSPDRTRLGTPFLTLAISGFRSALECHNLISSNSFAHRLGIGNSALRLPLSPVGLKPELRQGRSEFIYKMGQSRFRQLGLVASPNPIYKSKHGVCPSVCGDKNKTRSWNERGPQNLQGPEPRWPESSIKDLNRDSQYLVQTSRRTWNEVPRKKTRRWGPETRSSERKPVVRVLKRGCTPTGSSQFWTYWRRTNSRTQVRFSVGWCFWVFKEPPVQVL